MRKMHLIRQHDEKDCGAACLSMILDYYGKKLPMAQVREAIMVDQYGANVYGMVEGAGKFQLTAEAFTGSPEEVWAAMAGGEVAFPSVIRIVTEEGYEHYAVVKSVRGDALQINDPDRGKVTMKKAVFMEKFLGQVIIYTPGKGFVKENQKKAQLRRFTGMLLTQKKLLFVIAFLSLAVTGTGIAGSFIFRYIIDTGLGSVSGGNADQSWIRNLGVIMLALGTLYIFRSLFQMMRGMLLMKMSRDLDLSLALGYYDHVADLPLDFFVTRKTGEITSRFDDAGRIRDALSNAALTVMIDSVMVLSCGVILYRESPRLFLISLLLMAGYVLVTMISIRPLDRAGRDAMEKNAQLGAYLKESIDGMETVKAAGAEGEVKAKAGGFFQNFMNASVHNSVLSLRKDTAIEALTSVGTLAVLWFGVMEILAGRMTLGTLITFNSLLAYFLSPIQNMVQLQDEIQQAVAAADRLNDVLDIETESREGKQLEGQIESIDVDHVSFRYGYRELVLKDMSFRVRRGEKIALVGGSGCGKSTTVKLLMGMYTPEAGTVRVNGFPVSKLSLVSLRKHIAYVPQTTFLFSGTVRDNLLLGLEGQAVPSDERIYNVLEKCQCEFILQMPFGIDSPLEENGANLSGGQRQRLAIARAVLRNPELLILDEATSSLDTVTEYQIQQALDELLPDAAVIMVAHRLSTVKKCTRIYVIKDGQVAESGTDSQLREAGGMYSDLLRHQIQAA